MLRFFVKEVAKDTTRAAAGQLVGLGIIFGVSQVANTKNRLGFWNSFLNPMNTAAGSNSASTSPNPKPAELVQEHSSSISGRNP